jgi:hypothetical protein
MSETQPPAGPIETIVAAEVAKVVAASLATEPAPAASKPNPTLRAALQAARGKAQGAKRQLMLDNLADALCDTIDAMLEAMK